MKFRFLGTAAAEGVPALFCDCDNCEQTRKHGGKSIRTRSQSLVNADLLIDFPADTYLHVLRDGLPLHKIYDCIITHDHSDHFYINDFFMRAPGFSNLSDNRPFNIYGSSTVADRLKSVKAVSDMIDTGCICVHEVKPYESFCAAGYEITPLKADHGAENSLMYLIKRDGKTILYAHDTGIFPDETWDWLEKNKPAVDFATFDCCYSIRECRSNHMGLNEVKEVTDRLLDMEIISEKTKCFANHFSHNNGLLYEDMRECSLKYGIDTSYDGLEVEF